MRGRGGAARWCVYFQFVYGRFPTRDDINGGNHLALRLAMLDACVTGSARRGVIPP